MQPSWQMGTALILAVATVFGSPGPPRNDGRSWPTLHGDLQRAGFYPHFPKPPLRLVWRHELWRELTGPRAEVIVADGLAYMGTYAGNMYAWDADSGKPRWIFRAAGPIGHSPAYADGVLFFGTMDARFYAVDVPDGTLRWQVEAEAGIWVSPTVWQGHVMFGDRAGVFHCLRTADGKPVWQFRTSNRILTPASIGPTGRRVFVGSEDMHLYCLDAGSGRLLWRSRKLAGLSLRDYAPLVAGGLVFVTTNPVRDFHTILDQHQQMLIQWTGYRGPDPRYIPGGPAEVRREQDRIVAFLKAHPDEQTFYAFRVEDGQEPWVAPVLYTGGMHNPTPPPCHNPQTGEVFTWLRSAYSVWDGGGEVRPLTAVGRLDLKSGRVALIEHGYRSREPGRPAGAQDMPWATFNAIGDETQALSCAPGWLFSNHQGYLGGLNLRTGRTMRLFGKRDTYGGYYGPGAFGWEHQGGLEKTGAAGQPYGLVNEWHGPARAIASVANGRVYYAVGAQVLCFEGERQAHGEP